MSNHEPRSKLQLRAELCPEFGCISGEIELAKGPSVCSGLPATGATAEEAHQAPQLPSHAALKLQCVPNRLHGRSIIHGRAKRRSQTYNSRSATTFAPANVPKGEAYRNLGSSLKADTPKRPSGHAKQVKERFILEGLETLLSRC